jgi:hypothetical protein
MNQSDKNPSKFFGGQNLAQLYSDASQAVSVDFPWSGRPRFRTAIATKMMLRRSFYHAAFLGRRAGTEERSLVAEAFLVFTSVGGFTYSSKLGQMVAKPQWTQSGF